MENFTIGYEAKRIVCNGTGLGNYARTLVNDLSDIIPQGVMLNLYAPNEGKEALRRQVKTASNIRFVYPNRQKCRLQQDLWRISGVTRDIARNGVQLFHGMSGELPMGLKKASVKTVVTIHDAIFMAHPEWYSWFDAKILAWKFKRTCREADHIIAISECTKRDIMRFGGVPANKISVIYQSCGTRFKQRETESKLKEVRFRYSLPERYVICVGTIEERKNVLLAVKAMKSLPEDLSLVIVGRPTPYAKKVYNYVNRHGLDGRIRLFHGVPHGDLPSFYQLAEAAVYPSRYEGFGIPVIEAIQSGLPVVACKGSCLEEAGGPDTFYVAPDDVDGMAKSLMEVAKFTPPEHKMSA